MPRSRSAGWKATWPWRRSRTRPACRRSWSSARRARRRCGASSPGNATWCGPWRTICCGGRRRGERTRASAPRWSGKEPSCASSSARRRASERRAKRPTRPPHARRARSRSALQLRPRRDALAELDRERVGLAPAAQALLKARTGGDAVLGPLSDFVRTSRGDAELAERLLGEWLHAVLVRDAAAVDDIRRWHAAAQPGPLLLLPCVPGPRLGADGHPLRDELRVDGPAAAWVRALLAGHEVLDGGHALRRANGAVFLPGATGGERGGGPLLRRAELEALEAEVREGASARSRAAGELDQALAELAQAEADYAAAVAGAERARGLALEAGSQQGDAVRAAAHARR